MGYRKEVVRKNLKNAFPEKSKEERRKIEKGFYQHFCDVLVETIKMYSICQEDLLKRLKYKGIDIVKKYAENQQSFVIVQGHYGNWEWSTSIASQMEHEILSVYKPLHNAVMDKFFFNLRKKFGPTPVSKYNILRVLSRKRKAQKLVAVGLVSDQTPNESNMTYWTKFLNQDTAVVLGPEKIATMFKYPVLFLKIRKEKRGYYEIEFVELFDKEAQLEEFEITEAHVRMMEEQIKAAPEYWMWSHRRWKKTREDAED